MKTQQTNTYRKQRNKSRTDDRHTTRHNERNQKTNPGRNKCINNDINKARHSNDITNEHPQERKHINIIRKHKQNN